MNRLIATVGGVGHLKPAPGTWGSAVGLIAAIGLHLAGGFWLLLVATLAVSAIGYWAVMQEVGETSEDPPEFVIDEVVGQWVAVWPVSFGAMIADAHIMSLYPGLIVAFAAFRVLDIWKPGPIGWADKQHGAFGIMMDDLIAGWIGAMIVAAFAVLAHGLMA